MPFVTRLHDEIVKILHRQDVTERLGNLGFEIVGSTPDEFSAYIRQQGTKYDKLIKQIGLKAE